MAANYNNIANIYDLLSRTVFGNYIVPSQVCLLRYLPSGSHVLIAGGGTGWILEEISKLHKQGLTIDYVEASAQMTALSEKRNYENNLVNFINQGIEDFTPAQPYDVILTPFLFDNFKRNKAVMLFGRLDAMLKTNGVWLFADFVLDEQKSAWWQKLLLKTMYLFFRITTHIETSELENMDSCFDQRYKKQFEARFYGRFIKAQVFQKF